MNRRWFINRTNPEYIQYLSSAASVSPLFAQVLINRGIRSPGALKEFLNPGITGLSDPFDLPHIRVALERIKTALTRNERVLVHGDYDADGLTATAIVVDALRTMGMDVHFFIPNRMVHGYGFNLPSVDHAERLGVTLIITVDCGITSFDAVAHARKKGIDVIVTDHHEPLKSQSSPFTVHGSDLDEERPEEFVVPDGVAVVNPKLNGQNPQLRTLSGAGIAFKIVQAMAMDEDLPYSLDNALSLIDIAALGTLADVVPLTGENRIIVKEGLRHIHTAYRAGLKALKQVSGVNDREMRAGLLSFTMIPRINAMGRMGDAQDVVTLLLSDSYETTLSIADRLDKTNTERQRIEEEAYQEALAEVQSKGHDAAIVLYSREWHTGIAGIVASRIAEEFLRPTFIFTIEDDIAKGSARSIPAFDIYTGLSKCSDLFLSFGGHKQAAGIRLNASQLPLFEKRINEIVIQTLSKDDFIPTLEIDVEASLSEVSLGLLNELSLLEPIGYGNPEPLLGAKGLTIMNPKIVGSNHLKMRLKQGSWAIDTIGFNMGKLIDHLDSLSSIDAAFSPMLNEWNGSRNVQLNLKAFRPSSRQ